MYKPVVYKSFFLMGFPGGSVVNNSLAMHKIRFRSLGWEDHLKREIVTHSSILAWKIPWTEDPGRPQSMGLQKSHMRLGN